MAGWQAYPGTRRILRREPKRGIDVNASRDPWREVVHIDIASPGKRGARPWCLTLSCGHTVFRSRGDTRDEVAVVSRFLRGRLRFAPKRCRCLHCGLREREGLPPAHLDVAALESLIAKLAKNG
jgi:hypothetical protein